MLGQTTGTQVNMTAREEMLAKEEPSTPVKTAIQKLADAVSFLDESVMRHEKRVRPCLTPESVEAVGANAVNPESPKSDLANAISDKADAIASSARYLNNITARVEL